MCKISRDSRRRLTTPRSVTHAANAARDKKQAAKALRRLEIGSFGNPVSSKRADQTHPDPVRRQEAALRGRRLQGFGALPFCNLPLHGRWLHESRPCKRRWVLTLPKLPAASIPWAHLPKQDGDEFCRVAGLVAFRNCFGCSFRAQRLVTNSRRVHWQACPP